MAEFPADGHFAPASDVSYTRLINTVGGIVSIALVAGIGIWGYKMVMRDVSGVPVVRAMQGDTRRVPADAGGSTADFQGLAVNHVAADKQAEQPPTQVTLAPAPGDLDADALTPEQMAARQQAEARRQQQAERIATLTAQAQASTGNDLDAVAELALAEDEIAQQNAPRATLDEGIHVSMRPRLRPAGLNVTRAAAVAQPVEVAAAAAAAASAPAPAAPVDGAAVPPGTRLAQLGAFASEDVAISEWDRLSKQFDIYMDGKSRVIQKAETGGRTFYRLRVMGFNDDADARQFCAALVADRADCIPVISK